MPNSLLSHSRDRPRRRASANCDGKPLPTPGTCTGAAAECHATGDDLVAALAVEQPCQHDRANQLERVRRPAWRRNVAWFEVQAGQWSLAQNVVGGHAPGSGRVSSLTDHRVPRAVSGLGGLQAYGELRDRAGELRDRYGATCGNFVIADTHLNLREPHRYFDFSTETCSPAHTARPDQALPRVCAGQRPFSLIPSYRVC